MQDDAGNGVEDNGTRPGDPAEGESVGTTVPEDAFISPDEPIVRKPKGAVLEDAFISPDEPIVRTHEPLIGKVVGMDGAVHHLDVSRSVHLDPEQVANILEETAHHVREDGIRAGLQVSPDAPHFEAVLKAYLAGYFSED